ncbi:MAG: amino acid adenylation domain-containing protein [Ginsengibacter sp.]
MLTATEEDQLLKTFNDTASDYPKDKNIADLFEEQAAKTPQSIALIYEEEELTYGELNERSSQLARYLQKKGVREETLVPICVERGIGMMVGILGILKSGGAYVPIDPEYPQDRISYMLEDTAAAVIVSSKAGKEKLPAKAGAEIILIDGDWDEISKEESSNLHVNIASNNLAYVIYTSGSTGKPKGVLVEQGNVVSLVKGINYVSLNNEDKLLSTGSSSFDATTFEYWGMLLNGGQLILCEEAKLLNSELLKKEIERRKVSKMWFTSSWFNQLVENDISIFENLQTILAGGEKLSEQHIRKIRQTYPGIEIINGYGPTENTTFSLTYTITETEITNNIPIGRPLNNRHAYIMNDSGQLAPVGVPGEIYLGGAGLARGYLNREELTAERFIENPFASAAEKEEKRNPRLYKTGDIGKWLPDGNIEYLGRADDQVKLRGYRIELGEIESVIAQSGLVKHAVVMAPTHKTGHRYLAGYVVAEGTFNKEALNTYLHSKLPEYMIPAVWIELEQMPLTSNGKIDKKALALPDAAEQLRNEYVAPGNELEEQLTEIWQELLGTERVGVTDNFFELGGDSILTIQVVSRARRLGYELKPRDLFIHQTIAKLSPVIAGRSDAVVSGEQGLLKGAAGLLPIQQWYLEDSWKSISHFNQSVLLGIDKNISPVLLGLVFDKLVSHHDALRFKYFQKEGKWHQEYGTNSGGLITEDLRSVEEGQLGIVITKKADMHQRSLDIYKGDLIRMVWMQTPDTEKQNRLLIIVHHLAIDGVSWRILVENIEYLITELQNNPKADLGVKSTSYRQWYEALKQYGELPSVLSQINYWENVLDSYRPLATYKFSDEKITAKDICNETMVLEPLQTNQLLKDVPKTYNTAINDILLCALSMTLSNWGKTGKVVIGLEGHGREEIANDVDISRTVGWFTNLYPVLIEMDSKQQDVGDMIKSVKAQLRQVPDKGLGFGILKYINKEKKLEEKALWNVVFNYLGQLDTVVQAGKLLTGARESAGQSISDEFLVKENLSVNGSVKGGRLILGFRYNSKNYEKEAISGLIKNYKSNLELLIDHCIEQQKNGLVFTADSISEPETNLQRTQISVTKRISNKYLVPIKITGEKIPLYIVAGGGGTARKFMNFAKMLDTNQPVYCLQSPLEYADIKDFPGTIEEMASRFVEEIIQQDPHGPFSLAGHCTGGLVALEIARQLKEKGKTVHSLVMFDTIANRIKKDNPENTFKFYHVPVHIKRFISKVKLKLEFELFLLRRHKKKAIEYKINSLKSFIKKIKKDNRNIEIEMGALEVLKYSEKIYSEAHRNYKCLHYDGEIVLFYAKERNFFTDADNNIKFKRLQLDEKAKNRWGYYADSIKIHELEGEHSTIFENEMTKEFATTLQKYLNDELQ